MKTSLRQILTLIAVGPLVIVAIAALFLAAVAYASMETVIIGVIKITRKVKGLLQ